MRTSYIEVIEFWYIEHYIITKNMQFVGLDLFAPCSIRILNQYTDIILANVTAMQKYASSPSRGC